MRSIKLPSWIERLSGLAAVASPPHVFELTQDDLRYGCIERGSNGLSLKDEATVSIDASLLPQGPLGGPLRELTLFGERVDALLENLAEPPAQASLVLPDNWLRLATVSSEGVPPRGPERLAVLRFKLKGSVPFRVEDLRVEAARIGKSERLLLGYGVEALFHQLENCFATRGVHLGIITNASLAFESALRSTLGDDTVCLMMVSGAGYSVLVRGSEGPLFFRFKSIAIDDAVERVVRRDLALTKRYMDEHLEGIALDGAVVTSEQDGDRWASWLGDALEMPAVRLEREVLSPLPNAGDLSWKQQSTFLGAAGLKVR